MKYINSFSLHGNNLSVVHSAATAEEFGELMNEVDGLNLSWEFVTYQKEVA